MEAQLTEVQVEGKAPQKVEYEGAAQLNADQRMNLLKSRLKKLESARNNLSIEIKTVKFKINKLNKVIKEYHGI